MASTSFVGANLASLLAASVLVVTGGVVATADLVDGGPRAEPVATAEPSDEPSGEPSADETGSAPEPSADEPSADEPSADEPSADEPSADEPSADGPSVDETAEKPSVDGERDGGVGPDATGPAAFGLCNAWGRGGLGETSTARRNLEEAAGGAGAVESYCEEIVSAKREGQGRPDHAGKPDLDRAGPEKAGGRPDHAGGPGVRTAEPPGRAAKAGAGATGNGKAKGKGGSGD